VFSSSKSVDHAASEDLLPAFFAMDRYCQNCPDDANALHLFALICERIGQSELGIDLIRRSIAILEAAYEDTEDTAIERQFIIANSNLARLLLSHGEFGAALETFESVTGLLGDIVDEPGAAILRTQAQFGSALAMFNMGDLEASLGLFRDALDNSTEGRIREQVTVMLARALWAIGSEDACENAKAQLLEW
jgi:superkiller protein 3